MRIPILCDDCGELADFIRKPFAWVTVCRACMYVELQHDPIIFENPR